MKWKLLLIVGFLSATFMSVVVWRMDKIVYGDRMTWVESQARSSVLSINKAIEAEIRSIVRSSATVSIEALKSNKDLWRNLNPSFVAASAIVGQQGQLQIQNFVVKEKSPGQNWTAESLEKWLTGIRASRAKAGDVWIRPISDNNKNKYIVEVVFDSESAKLFISTNDFFLSLMDNHKGGLGQVMILNDDGVVVAHGTAEYVGTRSVDDPVVKEIRKTGSPTGIGEYDSEDGKIFGFFEKVKSTNLYSVMTATSEAISSGRKNLIIQFAMIGLGLVLLGFAGVLLIVNPYENGFKKITAHMSQLLKLEKVTVDPSLPRELFEVDELISSVEMKTQMAKSEDKPTAVIVKADDSLDSQAQKMQAYKQIAESLGHEMKSPLIAVLGYAQVIESMSQDISVNPEIRRLTGQLLNEARTARAVMEKLFSFSGSIEGKVREVQADVPVRNLLAKLDAFLTSKGIEVKVKVEGPMPRLQLAVDSVSKAIEAVVLNSVQAMERMPQKTLSVNIKSADGKKVEIEIQDSGEGIDTKNLQNVFDPFFTTRSFAHHIGMGLSMAYGIIKQHGGEITIESNLGKGTVVRMSLDPNQEKLAEAEVIISDSLPAVTNETLEMHYAEKIEEAEVQMKNSDSPLKVDIQPFLDLPPEVNAEEKPIEAQPVSKSVAPTVAPSLDNDELTFIDGFLDDEIHSKPQSVVIAAPMSAAPKRSAKLDAFKVEIRRPGTRL